MARLGNIMSLRKRTVVYSTDECYCSLIVEDHTQSLILCMHEFTEIVLHLVRTVELRSVLITVYVK